MATSSPSTKTTSDNIGAAGFLLSIVVWFFTVDGVVKPPEGVVPSRSEMMWDGILYFAFCFFGITVGLFLLTSLTRTGSRDPKKMTVGDLLEMEDEQKNYEKLRDVASSQMIYEVANSTVKAATSDLRAEDFYNINSKDTDARNTLHRTFEQAVREKNFTVQQIKDLQNEISAQRARVKALELSHADPEEITDAKAVLERLRELLNGTRPKAVPNVDGEGLGSSSKKTYPGKPAGPVPGEEQKQAASDGPGTGSRGRKPGFRP